MMTTVTALVNLQDNNSKNINKLITLYRLRCTTLHNICKHWRVTFYTRESIVNGNLTYGRNSAKQTTLPMIAVDSDTPRL